MSSLVTTIQKDFEALYNLELAPTIEIEDYISETETGVAERLLIRESGDHLDLLLCLNKDVLRRLAHREMRVTLDPENLEPFLTLIEGVSHFVLLVSRAVAERPVSLLELELQAEVDKFLFCFLALERQGQTLSCADLRYALFGAYHLVPSLSEEERERYEVANGLAYRYCASLETLTRPSRRRELIERVRRFHQFGLQEKIRETSY